MDHTKYASLRVGDRNSNIGNITNSYNTISNGSDEDRQIMQWLSPLEPQNRHDGIRSDRLEGVGNWLLETNEFREWGSGEGGADKAVLFCHGNPGVGKTYLNCLVMDHLYDRAREAEITVAGIYCDFREQQEQTTANVIGAIHKQLALKYQGILELVRREFLMAKTESGRRPQLGDHVRMLKIAISSLSRVFLCFDALDEFTPKQLPELLVSLREIIWEIPSVRVFFTGRPHVEELVTRFFTKAIMIPISPNSNDIKKYVERKLEMDIELHAMNDTLRADVLRTIREKIAER
ncbi:hypothetical protein L873DRAFT_1715454 [Choiromyces venosus 120613-1]|uniref:Nephrocystin 3-like N-terminal domain-containing protein n=1 Tax=Choiromyces venosus 120613-1 TaxID=1336337 RepID=A0A3N4IY47_9PEZI|nr:hypothetical protein L873DRAFT_1715454 [Choiromyces venosus 120613-1]